MGYIHMLVHAISDPIEYTREIGKKREEEMERKIRTRMRSRARREGDGRMDGMKRRKIRRRKYRRRRWKTVIGE
jgi:hypothetical protein